MLLHRNLLIIILISLSHISYSNPIILKTTKIYSPQKEKFLKNKNIFIKDGIINNITENNLTGKDNYELFDLSDLFVFPGLIDLHTHLFLNDLTNGTNFGLTLKHLSKKSKEDRLDMAINRAQQLLKSGFTTLRDLGNSGQFYDVELKKLITKNKLIGPRLFVSGPGICIYPCQYPIDTPKNIITKEYTLINKNSDMKSIIRKYKSMGVDWIKVYADNHPSKGKIKFELLSNLIKEAKKSGFLVAVHAEEDDTINIALECGANTIEHGYNLNFSTIEKWTKNPSFFIPTDLSKENYQTLQSIKPNYYNANDINFWINSRKKRLLKFMLKNSTKFAFGSDLYFNQITHPNMAMAIIKNLKVYSDYGLSTIDILNSLTINAARALGQNDKLGEIKKNALGDIIAFKSNPIKNISHLGDIVFVMKDGKVVFDEREKSN